MRVLLYPHGGSGNHGCEAIVRASAKILETYPLLFSMEPKQDIKYGLNLVSKIKRQYNDINKCSLGYLKAAFEKIVLKDSQAFDRLALNNCIREARHCDFALSIGGDNYCYGVPEHIIYINRCLKKVGVPRILWGCSINPEAIEGRTLEDLKQYNLIIARESMTKDALIGRGINNIKLIPDPAFQLNSKFLSLPEGWIENNTIGLNISPMVMGLETGNDILLKNYEVLIEYLLDKTSMSIALIPHVVWKNNDDREPLKYLYNKYKSSDRVLLLPDYNAEEVKGFIARCRFMIAARTHASIAAYSTQVPTIVVGYSIKAKGIAKDIFGSYNHFVVPVQDITNEDDLMSAFKWLEMHETDIREHLSAFMPDYCARVMLMRDELYALIKE